ncbi:PREDICTED: uncharacterized protein LOC105564073 [Vollenhovia emeryi]|uniref:uncharacterized protein LOC105564073 n=1 Tax=Vollenhovia emeryi TaxID=411798 RepID=UPI0005F37DA4|nr:PREDICTED: uncharacterized protein LOC105564073 [Vollenhovia emeryi]
MTFILHDRHFSASPSIRLGKFTSKLTRYIYCQSTVRLRPVSKSRKSCRYWTTMQRMSRHEGKNIFLNNLVFYFQSADLTRASAIVNLNRRFLGFLGLWPCKLNHFLFAFFTMYMIIYLTMAVGHLIKIFGHLQLVVGNLTDNVLFAMILGKMFICRRSSAIMAKFLKSIEADFTTEMYDNVQEKMAYLYYNEIAVIFIKFSLGIAGFTATLYYLRKFLENWSTIVAGNFSYELPYPVHPFFEIEDTTTYICMCLYLAMAIPIIVCGYSGPDAYVLSMALHVCGQFAALSCKVDNLLRDHENYHRHITNIVLRHHQLITLAEILENNFNLICLQQTLGTVFLLCFTLYHMMLTSEVGEDTNVVVFVLYAICVFSTILAYCYIGECLITESTALREAFYNSDWYNNAPSRTKLVGMCMIRSEKPLMLTAGKFVMLSLNTFTSIVKTSMAYLSMLRQFGAYKKFNDDRCGFSTPRRAVPNVKEIEDAQMYGDEAKERLFMPDSRRNESRSDDRLMKGCTTRFAMKNEVDHIEDLFVHLERIFSIGGIWPSKRTYFRFAIYITHFALYLVMAYRDFYDVFGNLELMVMNLVETVAYSMTFPMVWLIRCSNVLRLVIDVIKKDMVERKFENSEEERIYYNYNFISKIFTYGSIVGMFITVVSLYLRPLVYVLTANQVLRNGTESFMLPYRVHPFFDTGNTHTYILMYLYLFPMIYISVCHMAAICLMVILVFHICGELSILSYRIRHIGEHSEAVVADRIRSFVRMHLKIIWLAKSVDDTFNLVLLDELLGNSVVLAISLYYVIMNLEVSEIATCCTFTFFAIIALVMLFGYCLIGDQLTQQCINVQNAYYECNWYKMPVGCKRCLLICMIRGQVMLYLTAGKFYIFSLNSFTDVIKTSLAYLSMLRTLL